MDFMRKFNDKTTLEIIFISQNIIFWIFFIYNLLFKKTNFRMDLFSGIVLLITTFFIYWLCNIKVRNILIKKVFIFFITLSVLITFSYNLPIELTNSSILLKVKYHLTESDLKSIYPYFKFNPQFVIAPFLTYTQSTYSVNKNKEISQWNLTFNFFNYYKNSFIQGQIENISK